MNQRIAALIIGIGLAAATAGCGGDSDQASSERSASPSGSPSPSASGSVTPTPGSATPTPPPTSTTGPPNKPTDTVAPGWVVGTIMAASSGPCYGLVTDDGKEYALHSTAGFAVNKGQRFRVRVDRLAIKIYCGPGTHAAIKEHEKIG